MNDSAPGWRLAAAVVASLMLCLTSALAQTRAAVRNGDYIVAVINTEAVTAGEVERGVERAREAARRDGQRLPPEPEVRRRVLESLIEERVLITHAREAGVKIDDVDVDRAVQGVAVQNQLTVPQLRARLEQEGIDYARFRANLRDQMMVERVREREVYQRIRVTDAEIDRLVEQRRAAAQADAELNIAQILVTVPEGASAAVRAERKARADAALARVRRGEDFAAVARELSEDANRAAGGAIGLRPASRLPDVFVEALRGVPVGGTAPELLATGAGFHVLKLVERREGAAMQTVQTHARHILLRTSAQLSAEVAGRRLAEMRRQIESGQARFEDLARQSSDDGTAAAGGDLGWVGPGVFVPEFEEAMDKLPIGGLSAPVVSRFGVHLIQVLERRQVAVEQKQLREQARNMLREQKFEQAYLDWARDLRSRSYVELRDPPL